MDHEAQAPVCSRDCFNCIYPDCILDDGPDAKETAYMDRIENRYLKTDEQRAVEKQRASARAYYYRNREAILARDAERRKDPEYRRKKAAATAAWYEANREKARARNRARNAERRKDPEVRAKDIARARAYRAANLEKVREYQRQYRAKKKAERG